MTAEPYEDVPGANRAGRQLRARQFAAMLLVAEYGCDTQLQANVIVDFTHAGFSVAQIFAAASDLRQTYQFDERAMDEALDELRRMVTPTFDSDEPQLIADYCCADIDASEDAGGWFGEDRSS